MKKIIYSSGLILSLSLLLVVCIVSCKKKSSTSNSSSSSSKSCNLDCKNGGTCVNNACNCPDGWGGSTCETYYTNAYTGEYSTNSFNCTGANSTPLTTSVALDANDKSKLLIGSFYAILTDKTHFTIPSQVIGGAMTISGSGTIDGKNLSMSYTGKINAGSTTISSNCSGTFSKK